MATDDKTLTEAQKLKALRLIEAGFEHEENPTLRGCGLIEGRAKALKDEKLIDLFPFQDTGSFLDDYRVEAISVTGLGILARSALAEHEHPQLTYDQTERHHQEELAETRQQARSANRIACFALLVAIASLGLSLWQQFRSGPVPMGNPRSGSARSTSVTNTNLPATRIGP